MKTWENREGLCFISKYGESFVTIEYISSVKVKIRFKNNYEKWVTWDNIIKDRVISPYAKTIHNVGYLGEGEYNNQNCKKEYEYWRGMIRRCYDPYYVNKHLTYKDCFVEEYFHCFQNFVEWIKSEYPNINEDIELDKDILEKGNKIYDREHIILIPKRINSLFVKCNLNRGRLPIGVCYHEATDKYMVQCSTLDNKKKSKHLGCYNTIEEAFLAYKTFKENYIKRVADEYYSKGLISKKLYDAMYKYEVELYD